jgi:hypothetical protein
VVAALRSYLLGGYMASKKHESCFIITYRDPVSEKQVSVKAGTVADSTLGLSFIAVSDFIFDQSPLVVNPQEEDMKRRFADVKTLHLSIYTVLSIEEIGAQHKGLRFKKDKSNLLVLPGSSGQAQQD